MLRIALIAAVAGLMSTTALASPGLQVTEPDPAPRTAPATATEDGDRDPAKIICRNVRPPTGTRVRSGRTRQRVCQTRATWEEQEREAQESARSMRTGTCGAMTKGLAGGSCSGSDN